MIPRLRKYTRVNVANRTFDTRIASNSSIRMIVALFNCGYQIHCIVTIAIMPYMEVWVAGKNQKPKDEQKEKKKHKTQANRLNNDSVLLYTACLLLPSKLLFCVLPGQKQDLLIFYNQNLTGCKIVLPQQPRKNITLKI